MIIVMKEHASERQIERAVRAVMGWGLDVHRSTGAHRAVLGVVGDLKNVRPAVLEKLPGVARLVYVSTTPEALARERRRMDAPKTPLSVGIVGLGQMGGSLAMALRENWPGARITGFVRKKRGRKIPSGVVHRLTYDAGEAAACDIVVFAAPVRGVLGMLPAWAKYTKRGSVWTDVGSTKEEICRAAARAFRGTGAVFVGGHPMAGGTGTGIAYARADLYENETWALTPPDGKTFPREANVLKRIVKVVGSRLVVMSPREHDRAVAATSHLPQIVSSALAASVAPSKANAALVGPGFRSATRLALSPYAPMWRDIFLTNKGNVKRAMREFEKIFRALRSLDDRRLARVFETGRRTREKMEV